MSLTAPEMEAPADGLRALLIDAGAYDTRWLLAEWRWLVPGSALPLLLSVFGDWVFEHADASLWMLSLLEGNYFQIATDAHEYNTLNKSGEWLERIFMAGWQLRAAEHGLEPGKDECLGWKVHPLTGGTVTLDNLKVFNMAVYQHLMGRLHRQVQEGAAFRTR